MYTKHGLSHSNTYRSWAGMIQRCTNPNNPRYKDWGGRGITVCQRWFMFINFYIDMGEKPHGTTLDRKDNSRGYSKANCEWATPKQQATHRRPQTLKKNNTTGFNGIAPYRDGRWRAYYYVGSVQHHVGYFLTVPQAQRALRKALLKGKV